MSSTADTSSAFSMEAEGTVGSNARDEDWETDYPMDPLGTKSDNTSEKPVAQSPVPSSPKNNCETLKEPSRVHEASEGLDAVPEAEEPPTNFGSGEGSATTEPVEAKEQEDSTLSQNNSAENDQKDDEILTFVVTVDGEDNKDVLVEVNGKDL